MSTHRASTRSEEEVGNEEAQQAQASHDLHRHTASRCALHAQSSGASRNALLAVLVHGVRLPLSQALLVRRLPEPQDLRLGLRELRLQLFRRGRDGRGNGAEGALLLVAL